MNINAIDHICLWVYSLEQSREYYQTLLGLDTHYRDDTRTTLILENEHIHFFMQQADDGFIQKQHLSLRVDDLAAMMAKLEQHAIKDYSSGEVNCFRYHNYKWCEWNDPNGIRLECVEILN